MTLPNEIDLLEPSERARRLGFSDIVKIRNRVLALKAAGTPVLQFEGGEPFMPTPDFVKDAMKRALDENQTRYAPSSGIPGLLAAITAKLNAKNGIPVNEGQVIVTAGGMHGLFCAFQVTVDPGDDVMFLSPYWTPIRDLVHYCGAHSARVPWDEVAGDDAMAALGRHLTPKTKVIYVNSPSNPTGHVLNRRQLEAIARFATERNLVVISDEAYEDLVYDGAEHVSIASLPGMLERTISCYTLSKSYSMTGWRAGYVAAADRWMDAIRKLVLNSVNGVSTPTQFAALAALSDRSDYLERMRSEYVSRRDHLVAALQQAGFGVRSPRGAFYLFADVRSRLGHDSWKAMNTLLDRTGIASVPGLVFGEEGEGHLRLSFSTQLETIEKAAEALKSL